MDVANKDLAKKIDKKVQSKHMKHYGDEQRSIIRQSSLKSAVELMGTIVTNSYVQNNDTVIAQTLSIAEKFEEWVTR